MCVWSDSARLAYIVDGRTGGFVSSPHGGGVMEERVGFSRLAEFRSETR